ncbi:MAG: hypothetical protein LBN12_09325 [Clostridiales Family XIII bacterium]|nr:hypothetical protein [Clostridiales Family XIII bacterium]
MDAVERLLSTFSSKYDSDIEYFLKERSFPSIHTPVIRRLAFLPQIFDLAGKTDSAGSAATGGVGEAHVDRRIQGDHIWIPRVTFAYGSPIASQSPGNDIGCEL